MKSGELTRIATVVAAALVLGGLASCGGDPDLSCDKRQYYQDAAQHRKVEVPDDLDSLDPLEEMPIPEANPAAPRPKGSPCVDLPPRLINVD